MEEFLLNDVLNPELIDLDNLLINHVRKYRFLYDKTNRFEQRSDLHDHTWAKIAKACGVTGYHIFVHLKILRKFCILMNVWGIFEFTK